MQARRHAKLCAEGLLISGAANLAMIVTGVLGSAWGRIPFLLSISRAIAAPPGLIINHCCEPKAHTLPAFLFSIVESLAVSLALYGLTAWAGLELYIWVRMNGTESPNSNP